jgi:hypothetical protein
MCAVISVAVDYGRVQIIKTQMQRAADATARAALQKYLLNNRSLSGVTSWAKSSVALVEQIDPGSGVAANVWVTSGYWKNNAFQTGTSSTYPLAVKVLISRSAANGNPVPLAFPLPSGNGSLLTKSVDVWASSVAILPNRITVNFTADGTDDPWLSGMPSGATASYDDAAPTNAPPAISVTPGSTLQFTNVSGTVAHNPSLTPDSAGGNTGQPYNHMMDSPDGNHNGVQNGIGDVRTPIDSLIGVFLDDNAPNTTSAPSTVRDYSTQAARDQTTYDDLQLKQPFYIGDGQTSSTTTQNFVVPPKATRMFLGPMDGYEWMNNVGAFTGTLYIQPPIKTVQ